MITSSDLGSVTRLLLLLIDVLDQIYYQLDNSKKVLGIFLDLQKAFDTVDHKILLAKLYNYGIRGIIYSWFKNYLTDRMQFVSVSGVNSQTTQLAKFIGPVSDVSFTEILLLV